MNNASADFGVLTLATPDDYLKAIGLSLSLRVSNPGVPVAVACGPKVADKVRPYFDIVVPEEPNLRGFIHKLYLDKYTPFEKTLFLDSDVLVFKPVQKYTESWACDTYTACGIYLNTGCSAFGMDRAAVLKKLDKQLLVVIDGAGHGYFEKPKCIDVFSEAREIAANYRSWAGDIPFADEDVINIVMTKLELAPAFGADFFARYLSARPGTMQMDAANGACHFEDAVSGQRVDPCMMHFAANEAAIAYTRQLLSIFRKFDVPTAGLMTLGARDFYEREIKLPIASRKRAVLSYFKPTPVA